VGGTVRRIFGPKRDEVKRGGENCILKRSIIFTLHQILFG
jgi:hypothetical protein